MIVAQEEQGLAGGHQNFAVVAILLGFGNSFIGVVFLPQTGVGAGHFGIDDRIVGTKSNGSFEGGERILVAMQAVLRLGERQVHLNVIGRELHCSLIFGLGVFEL